ncbi:MAG: hypothetical protein ABR521_04745 [Gaiellaceae bacterium]
MPNLYPALERQEVVVHSPRHVSSLAEVDDADLALLAEAWQRRVREVGTAGYVHAFVNERRAAGASLPHSHSQLVWLPAVPPEVARADGDGGGGTELVVHERGAVLLRSAAAPRAAYELEVVPGGGARDAWRDERLATALQLAAEALRRLQALEGPVAANLWLHAPPGKPWRIAILPRIGILAGLELGAGVYINPVPPDEAARALRCAGA